MKREIKGNLILLLTSMIWGMGFVAQTSAMDDIGPFTFLGIRFLLGAAVLLPIIIAASRKSRKDNIHKEIMPGSCRYPLAGGILCGLALFAGAAFQQIGIDLGAETGKAGFLTAMYILIVPVIELIFKKKTGIKIWICVIIAITGIYFLSVKKDLSIDKEDFFLIACAFSFAVQIMLIDYFVKKADPVKLSAIEFLVLGIIGIIVMTSYERPDINSILRAAGPIVFSGILSSGAGYTLQMIGQQYSKPAQASLIMSFESVFALLGGIIILHQKPGRNEYIGMALMFMAIIISQISFSKKPNINSRMER